MKIGFIGLGIMGSAMSRRIVEAHDDTVYIYDRNIEKVDKIVKYGAVGLDSASDIFRESNVIITMVPNSGNVLDLYSEVRDELKEGQVWIDMSTIDPNVSKELAKKVKKKGANLIDAPVVKSKPAAIKGELGIYVGGDEKIFNEISKILLYMGKNIIYMGDNGSGLTMKICHNALVAQIQNGVNETLNLAIRNGLKVEDYVKAISYGGGQNFYLDSKWETINCSDYTTAFSIKNMAKDINICLEIVSENNIELPGVIVAKEVYDKAIKKGYGNDDFSKTYEVIKEDIDEKQIKNE